VTPRVQALVVGGGISGLVCAYALRKAGLDAHLFEASPRPGGVIQSIARDGFLLELARKASAAPPRSGRSSRNSACPISSSRLPNTRLATSWWTELFGPFL